MGTLVILNGAPKSGQRQDTQTHEQQRYERFERVFGDSPPGVGQIA